MRLKQVSIFVHFVLYSISNFFSNILGCSSNLPSALFSAVTMMVTFCLWPEYTCPSLAYVLSPNRSCGSFKSESKGFGPSWTTLYAQCTHVQLSVLYGTTYVILSELECSRQEAWHTLCLEQLCCCTVESTVFVHLYTDTPVGDLHWTNPRVEYRKLYMCTLSVQSCSAWSKPFRFRFETPATPVR